METAKAIPGSSTKEHTQKRAILSKEILKLIDLYSIDHVVYEGIYAVRNPKTIKLLAKVQGSIEDLSEAKEVGYEEFPVSQWRSYLELNYKSKRPKREEIKEAVINYVLSIYPFLENEKEDILESVGMGIAWHKRRDVKNVKKEKEKNRAKRNPNRSNSKTNK